MGINDRDYIRDEGPSFLGKLSESGKVCKWLVGINVVVFLLQLATNPTPGQMGWVERWFILNTDAVQGGEIWRLLTSGFLHSPENLLHIVFNMLLLYYFGRDLEDMFGHREFLVMYLMCVIAGSVAFTAVHWDRLAFAYGASAGVTGVLVLTAFHFPNKTIYLFLILPVPVWLAVILFVGMDAFYFVSGTDNGVAVSAHLGGAAFAFFYYKMQWRLTGWFQGWSWPKKKPTHLRIYEEEDFEDRVPVSVMAANAEEEQLEAKLDRVLERISQVGRDNLTEEEKAILNRASELFKRRQH